MASAAHDSPGHDSSAYSEDHGRDKSCSLLGIILLLVAVLVLVGGAVVLVVVCCLAAAPKQEDEKPLYSPGDWKWKLSGSWELTTGKQEPPTLMDDMLLADGPQWTGQYSAAVAEGEEQLVSVHTVVGTEKVGGQLLPGAEKARLVGRFHMPEVGEDATKYLRVIFPQGVDDAAIKGYKATGLAGADIKICDSVIGNVLLDGGGCRQLVADDGGKARFTAMIPSQLNGAEYMSQHNVVELAVHPAQGQFILDNARSEKNPKGPIDAVGALLNDADIKPVFENKNGYLQVYATSALKDAASAQKVGRTLMARGGRFRTLMSRDVELSFASAKPQLNKEHANLIYGSAVPHINCSYVSNKNDFQEGTPARKVMDLTVFLVLVLQYYGALVHTANSVCDGGAASAHPVFLMLLGGGVFKNPDYYITTAISAAQEMYKLYVKEQKTQDCLDVQVLTWKSNSSEVNDISNLFIGMGRPVQRTDRL